MEQQYIIPFIDGEVYTYISCMDNEKRAMWIDSYATMMSELSDGICMLGNMYRLMNSFVSGDLQKNLPRNHIEFLRQAVCAAGKAYASLRTINHLMAFRAKSSQMCTIDEIKQLFGSAQELLSRDIDETISMIDALCKDKKDLIFEILSRDPDSRAADPVDNLSLEDIANTVIYNKCTNDNIDMHDDTYLKFVRAINCIRRVSLSVHN